MIASEATPPSYTGAGEIVEDVGTGAPVHTRRWSALVNIQTHRNHTLTLVIKASARRKTEVQGGRISKSGVEIHGRGNCRQGWLC